MWCNIFKAGIAIYSHRILTAILPCLITLGYFGVRHVWQPGTQVQSHLLQVLMRKSSHVIKPGSCSTPFMV